MLLMTQRREIPNRRRENRRGGFSLYPLWQWLVMVPVVAVATVLGAIVTIAIAVLVSPRLANLYVAVPWCRMVAGLTPVRPEILGRENADPNRSYVVVANHQSQYDIPVIYGFCGLDLRWVIKAELGRVPFIAQGCRAIGHIFIDRSDPEQARTAINEAVSRLPKGTGILFFAEGTRSRSGELLPFKKGAFRVAIDHQLPILPISVSGTRDIMPSDSLRIRPGRVRMVLHPPIDTTGLDPGDLDRLRKRVRAVIAAALEPSGATADCAYHSTPATPP